MKKLILVLTTVATLASCNNKSKQNAAAQRVRQATLDSVEYANQQQRRIDSLEALTRVAGATSLEIESPAMTPIGQPTKKTVPNRTRKNTTPAVTTGQGTAATPSSQAPTSTGNAPATQGAGTSGTVASAPEKKKGLNNAAKGAIIGLGTGAAAGAIIGKENRGKGAVIGGVVGAIGGAVGGAVIDKRNAKKAAERDSLSRDSIRRGLK